MAAVAALGLSPLTSEGLSEAGRPTSLPAAAWRRSLGSMRWAWPAGAWKSGTESLLMCTVRGHTMWERLNER